ncbi:hypothetical protein QRE66_18015 [Bacillus cereus]|nr:hypothetical protein QRE66_18015 [Bacillus cereus]
MSNDSIPYNRYSTRAPDYKYWKPIPDTDRDKYIAMIERVKISIEKDDNKEKGKSLEDLMTYVYSRFEDIADVFPDQRSKENQFDHIITFIEGLAPPQLMEYTGGIIIGESKNHSKKGVGSQEVANLYDFLKTKTSRLGIFSSFKTFTKGKKSMWANAEGKRRKLCLSSENATGVKRYVIGFTLKELESLLENNFYTMMKHKITALQNELDDDYTEDEHGLLYPDRLYYSLNQLKELGIICDKSFQDGKQKIEELYGEINV